MNDQRLPQFQWDSISYLATRVGMAGTTALGELMDAEGLVRRHFMILSALDEFGPMFQNDLADRTNINRGHLVAFLDDLEKHGSLERTVDSTDRRRKLLTLTASGTQFAALATETALASEEKIFNALNAQQRETLRDLLREIVSHDGWAHS